MNGSHPSDEWSDHLKAETRKAIENIDVLGTQDGHLVFKNLAGGFGIASMQDLVSGRLRITDVRTGGQSVFGTTDALIAAGWAID